MCGIVGYISSTPAVRKLGKENWVIDAMFADTLRGHHSTGMFTVNRSGKARICKTTQPGTVAFSLPSFEKSIKALDQAAICVVHNRYKTNGEITLDQCHPFLEKNVLLVHNGTVHDSAKMKGKVSDHGVDSKWIAHNLSEHHYKEVFKHLDGSYALVWYDLEQGRLYMIRNSLRPLAIAASTAADSLFFASEAKMLDWLCDRNEIELVRPAENIKEETLYFIDLAELLKTPLNSEIKLHEEKVEGYKYVAPKTSHGLSSTSTTTSASRSGGTSLLARIGMGVMSQKKLKPLQLLNRNDTDTVLKTAGLTLDGDIRFSVYDHAFKDDKSRHGRVLGIMLDSPFMPVISEGQPRDAVDMTSVNTATIRGVEISTGKPRIVLGKCKPTGTPDPYYDPKRTVVEVPSKPKKKKTKAANNPKNYPLLETLDLVENNDTKLDVVPGPNGILVPRHIWERLVSKGCAYCTGNINKEDADLLAWTHDKQPICPECATNPEIQDSGTISYSKRVH